MSDETLNIIAYFSGLARRRDRIFKAAPVMVEATMKTAEFWQNHAAKSRQIRSHWPKKIAGEYALARRYLFALVGDGRPEEECEVFG